MVRLKGIIMCIYHALPLLFQFHYGTIKSSVGMELLPIQAYFNSTMVRLKDATTVSKYDYTLLFQFHYGTIKRNCASLRRPRFEIISIPLWYD